MKNETRVLNFISSHKLLNKNVNNNMKRTTKKHDNDDKEDDMDNNDEDNHGDRNDDYDLEYHCSYKYQTVNRRTKTFPKLKFELLKSGLGLGSNEKAYQGGVLEFKRFLIVL